MKKTPTLALATLAVAAVLSGCGGADGSTGSDQTLTIAESIAVISFDPPDVGDNSAAQYLQPVYDTLLSLDQDGDVSPRLATEWEYTDRNQTTLRLTLRDDVSFTDGTKFDAEAAKANLDHFLAGAGPVVSSLNMVSEVRAVDATTLEIELDEPNPALLGYLGRTAGMMVSPKVLDSPSLDTTPVGSGPYVLDAERTSTGTSYVYERNEDYWNTDAYPYDGLVLNVITDATARLNAVRSGQADVGAIPVKSAGEVEKAGLDVVTFDSGDIMLLDFQDRDGSISEPLSDVRVRQAINHAIDREGIVKTLQAGQGSPTTQVFNADSSAFDAELDDAYPYDPAAARELLAQAGYADGFTVKIPDITAFADTFAVISQQLAEVGITVDPVKIPDAQVITESRSGKYPLVLFQLQSNDPWQALQLMVLPNAAWNPLGNSDAELDALLQTARSTTGDEQAEAYQAVDRYLVDEAWFAPITGLSTVYAANATEVTPYSLQSFVPIEGFAPAGS